MITQRPYRDLADLQAMHAILSAGAAADTRAFYVHPGDLSWWLFYTDDPAPLEGYVWLWEADGAIFGWTVFTVAEGLFDLFVLPDWLQRPDYAGLHARSEAELERRMRALGGDRIGVMWIADDDLERQALLTSRGFTRAGGRRLVRLRQSLEALRPSEALPDGCVVRAVAGEAELEARARPQAAAFKTKLPWDRYLARYRRFMHAPVYAGAHDTGLVLPDGAFAAGTIWWEDPVNRVGHFEPVATHPDLHRRGYGRALLLACLRHMQQLGLRMATVCAEAENAGNIAFYNACGFEVEAHLLAYEKHLENEPPQAPPSVARGVTHDEH